MNRKLIMFLLAIMGISLCMLGCATREIGSQPITIGTGGAKGMYFPTGGAICKTVNKGKRNHRISCSVLETKGSVDNINAFERGELQFGIARSEWIYKAYRGFGFWQEVPQEKLRTIFSIHREPIHLVADDRLFVIQDLRRKKVSIGNPESSARRDALSVLNAYKLDLADFDVTELKCGDAVKSFRRRQIDAFFCTVGDPNGWIKEVTDTRSTNFIPLEGPEVDEIMVLHPYYGKTTININWYPNAKSKTYIPTIGYKTIFFTTSDVSDETVYQITKQIFTNLKNFKKLHPAFVDLTKQNMVENLDNIAPVHSGALRYYEEIELK